MQRIMFPLEDGHIEIGVHRHEPTWRFWRRWVSCCSIYDDETGPDGWHLHHASFTYQAAEEEAYKLYRMLMFNQAQEGGSNGPGSIQRC